MTTDIMKPHAVAVSARIVAKPGDPYAMTMGNVTRSTRRYVKESSNFSFTAALIGTMPIAVGPGLVVRDKPLLAGVIILAYLLMTVCAAFAFGWHRQHHMRDREDSKRRYVFTQRRNSLERYIDDLSARSTEERRTLHADVKRIAHDDETSDLAIDMVTRIATLHEEYQAATKDAGRADTSAIKQEASTALEAITQDAMARYADIDRRLRMRDDAKLEMVSRRFSEAARSVSSLPAITQALPPHSATAALQRLVGLGEDALAVDPDLVDGTGSRLDALVREHLPTLLRVHAEAARSPSSDLARVDGELEKGLEEIRAGIEDALARDAQRRFDRLVDQVAFLHMRREA
jgi:hypothetical protein